MTAAFIFTKMQFCFISSSIIQRHDKLVSFTARHAAVSCYSVYNDTVHKTNVR